MHPVEVRGDRGRLVALHRPDEVPGEAGAGQRRDLRQRLLDVALAEIALTRLARRVEHPGGEALGDRDQGHGAGRAASGAAGLRDARAHGGESLDDRHLYCLGP
jgi:hypothetical protein